MRTAAELNITEAEWLALQTVAAGLAAGLYVHTPKFEDMKPGLKQFDMGLCFIENETCGSVGCIGGWVAREMGYPSNEASQYVDSFWQEGILHELYFPAQLQSYNVVTPAIAAEAIYQFLDGKPVDYPGLLANSPAA